MAYFKKNPNNIIMKRIILFLTIILAFLFQLRAQRNIIVEGLIYDSLTNEPIVYVNIGILGENIGTVSNELGEFKFSIPEKDINYNLTFSRIGYFTKHIRIKEFFNNEKVKIVLSPKITELQEVTINAKGTKLKTSGNKTKARSVVLGINSGSLGRELGTVIHLPDRESFLKDLNFNITVNNPDSAKFRINIYRFNGEIDTNVLLENIFFTLKGNQVGVYKVDLSKYNIVLTNDIFLSVETVAVFAKKNKLETKNDPFFDRINISGTITGSKSFVRNISLGKWEKIKAFSPGYWITYIDSK
jgi:hypothetical protein